MRDDVAIFDIGSNAVRLVIYDRLDRAPLRLHNERAVCSLGAGLSATGRLNPEGVELALSSLRRMSALVRALGVRRVMAVATAAVRDASDGQAFLDRVRDEFGLDARIIEGEEEARLSALGVMSNGLGQDGVIGDFGGGSLELVSIAQGAIGDKTSLPIGSHRLHAYAGRGQRAKAVEEALDAAPFLSGCAGRDFYVLGGAWRSIGKAHMHFVRYTLPVLDHYTISGGEALDFARLLARQGSESLEKTVGLAKRRVRDVSVAALALEKVLARAQFGRLVFSGMGLREGLLFDALPADERAKDPLIEACRKLCPPVGARGGTEALQRFLEPLFENADARTRRWLAASCLLSDIAALSHEEFQADQAFRQVLAMPLPSLDHAGRAFLAAVQYVRYRGYIRRGARGAEIEETTAPAHKLLNPIALDAAERAGMALRLAYALTGGALRLLSGARLEVAAGSLRLCLTPEAAPLASGLIAEFMDKLAQNMGLRPEMP